MLHHYRISKKYFTPEELEEFKRLFNYDITDIQYSAKCEIDFSKEDEKNFLFLKGYPRILARFFS